MRLQQLMEQHSKAELIHELFLLVGSKTAAVLDEIPAANREALVEQAVRMVNDDKLAERIRVLEMFRTSMNERQLHEALLNMSDEDIVDPRLAAFVKSLQMLEDALPVIDEHAHFANLRDIARRLTIYREWVKGRHEWPVNYTAVHRAAMRATLKQIGIV